MPKLSNPVEADPDQINASFGAAVRAKRLEAGWSQEKLAERADMAVAHLSAIERGLHGPNLRGIVRLARALGCPPADLLPPA